MYQERIEICKKCEYYESWTSRCKSCGCFMFLKARIDSASCPEGKWKRKIKNMAYFAQINFENLVTQVIVVNDEVIGNKIFPESEEIGINFCKSLFGQNTNWKQTSFEKSFRKNYAGIGYTYNSDLNAFVPPKPFNSWVLDPVNCVWEPPISRPEDGKTYDWNEESLSWKIRQS